MSVGRTITRPVRISNRARQLRSGTGVSHHHASARSEARRESRAAHAFRADLYVPQRVDQLTKDLEAFRLGQASVDSSPSTLPAILDKHETDTQVPSRFLATLKATIDYAQEKKEVLEVIASLDEITQLQDYLQALAKIETFLHVESASLLLRDADILWILIRLLNHSPHASLRDEPHHRAITIKEKVLEIKNEELNISQHSVFRDAYYKTLQVVLDYAPELESYFNAYVEYSESKDSGTEMNFDSKIGEKLFDGVVGLVQRSQALTGDEYCEYIEIVDEFTIEMPDVLASYLGAVVILSKPETESEKENNQHQDLVNALVARYNFESYYKKLAANPHAAGDSVSRQISDYIENNPLVLSDDVIAIVAVSMVRLLLSENPVVRSTHRNLIQKFSERIPEEKMVLVLIAITEAFPEMFFDIRNETRVFLRNLFLKLSEKYRIEVLYSLYCLRQSNLEWSFLSEVINEFFESIENIQTASQSVLERIGKVDDEETENILQFLNHIYFKIKDDHQKSAMVSTIKEKLKIDNYHNEIGQSYQPIQVIGDIFQLMRIGRLLEASGLSLRNLNEASQEKFSEISNEATKLLQSVSEEGRTAYYNHHRNEFSKEGHFAGRYFLFIFYKFPNNFQLFLEFMFTPSISDYLTHTLGETGVYEEARVINSLNIGRRYKEMAHASWNRAQMEQATIYLEKALLFCPSDEEIIVPLALIHLQHKPHQDSVDKAIKEIQNLVLEHPENETASLLLARMYVQYTNNPYFEEVFISRFIEKRFDTGKTNVAALQIYAWRISYNNFDNNADHEEGFKAIEKALGQKSTDPVTLYILAKYRLAGIFRTVDGRFVHRNKGITKKLDWPQPLRELTEILEGPFNDHEKMKRLLTFLDSSPTLTDIDLSYIITKIPRREGSGWDADPPHIIREMEKRDIKSNHVGVRTFADTVIVLKAMQRVQFFYNKSHISYLNHTIDSFLRTSQCSEVVHLTNKTNRDKKAEYYKAILSLFSKVVEELQMKAAEHKKFDEDVRSAADLYFKAISRDSTFNLAYEALSSLAENYPALESTFSEAKTLVRTR